jgi:N utilization substance protein B
MKRRATGRRAGRRTALFLLYQWDLTGQPLAALYEGAVDSFARELAEGVAEHAEELDERITETSTAWPAERLGALERNILRIALHELARGEVPPEVAINEAVELTKRYASEDAARLVNGVLGRHVPGPSGKTPSAADPGLVEWRVPAWLSQEGHPELAGVERKLVRVHGAAEEGEDYVVVEDPETGARYTASKEELR